MLAKCISAYAPEIYAPEISEGEIVSYEIDAAASFIHAEEVIATRYYYSYNQRYLLFTKHWEKIFIPLPKRTFIKEHDHAGNHI